VQTIATMPIRETLTQLAAGQRMTQLESEAFFEELLSGLLEPAQIGAALALIQARGASVEELLGGALVMRRHVTPVHVDENLRDSLIDTCGTGGAPKTFNVSTLAAIVAAAAAPGVVRVAKHGNKSRTGRGSAEVLQALGVKVDASPHVQSRCLAELGVCFSFAAHHHPAMKHAAPIRLALGFPTIFNLLGPLTNPAGARRQLMGVASHASQLLVAHTLHQLRCTHAWVVHSEDGLDELSIGAPTRVASITPAGIETLHIDPRSLGLASAPPHALQAEDLGDAVRIARSLFDGEQGPRRDMLLLNAGAAIVVGNGCKGDLRAGIALAREAIDRGHARALLANLAELSHVPPG
jgi:anthranilate phosphoribosyltransferase